MSLLTGDVMWAELGPGRGREQAGRRPVVVVSSNDYLDIVDTLAIVVPVTSRDRGWVNHVALTGETGLVTSSYAMVEQVTTISRDRIVGRAGTVDKVCLDAVQYGLRLFLGL